MGAPTNGVSAARQSRRRPLARPVALRGAGSRRFPARRATSGSRREVRPRTARRIVELQETAACRSRQPAKRMAKRSTARA
eukprot:11067112-Alexandrium_andersonii.AAC.1